MNFTEPKGTTALREPSTILAALVIVGTVLTGVLVFQALAPAPPSSASRSVDDPPASALDPGLDDALRRATADAADDGVELDVTSGWRSQEEQERLFREAVAKHGPAEAARRVALPGTSAHESGDAVDIGPARAAAWLSRNGAGYGLCQIYANEPWHFELRPNAANQGCPRMYADASHGIG